MDLWEPSQIEFMKTMGNGNAKLIWEAKLPSDYGKPSENEDSDLVMQWMRTKYEKKKYFSSNVVLPKPEEPAPKAKPRDKPKPSNGNGPQSPSSAGFGTGFGSSQSPLPQNEAPFNQFMSPVGSPSCAGGFATGPSAFGFVGSEEGQGQGWGASSGPSAFGLDQPEVVTTAPPQQTFQQTSAFEQQWGGPAQPPSQPPPQPQHLGPDLFGGRQANLGTASPNSLSVEPSSHSRVASGGVVFDPFEDPTPALSTMSNPSASPVSPSQDQGPGFPASPTPATAADPNAQPKVMFPDQAMQQQYEAYQQQLAQMQQYLAEQQAQMAGTSNEHMSNPNPPSPAWGSPAVERPAGDWNSNVSPVEGESTGYGSNPPQQHTWGQQPQPTEQTAGGWGGGDQGAGGFNF